MMQPDAPKSSWIDAIISENSKVIDVIKSLEKSALKIALVCDERRRLIGILSDGDVRRSLLTGSSLNSPIEKIINRNPVCVPETSPADFANQLMTSHRLQQIPIVNSSGVLIGLRVWGDSATEKELDNHFIVMAGGKGTRLLPRTEKCPKPMLTVAGRPILEHIVLRAKSEGFRKFIFSVCYLKEVIENYFGDGERFGVDIEYIKENKPLGTAGALSLLAQIPEKPFVVVNADLLTEIKYRNLLEFHENTGAHGTMAIRAYNLEHPFGVIQVEGVDIKRFEEKPIFQTKINAGVYVLSPEAICFLTFDQRCDMPELFERLLENGKRIVGYSANAPWLDVGRPEDLLKAEQFFMDSE